MKKILILFLFLTPCHAQSVVKKEVIYEAINSEIGHLVKNIFKALKDSGYFEQINCGITMIGGGAHLPTAEGSDRGRTRPSAGGARGNAAVGAARAGGTRDGRHHVAGSRRRAGDRLAARERSADQRALSVVRDRRLLAERAGGHRRPTHRAHGYFVR